MTPVQFSENFLSEIERSNLEKEQAPLALVLRAEYDPEGVFHYRDFQHLILQVADSGYQVAIKEISDASLLGKKIQETSEETHKNISFLTIAGHGHPNLIQLGDPKDESKPTGITKLNIKKEDFSSLDEGAKIFLLSCSTGRGLAQDIANISERTVTAARTPFRASQVFFNSNTKSLMCGDNVLNFYEYRFGEEPTQIISDESIIKQAYTERLVYLKDLANRGDAIATTDTFRSIKDLWRQVYGTQEDEEILYWCRRAADALNPEALTSLALFHEDGMYGLEKSDNEAVRFYLTAAMGNNAVAQYKMGIFYERGRGGLIPSDYDALYWYRCSAAQDYMPAQFRVGLFIEEGRGGFDPSDERALSWYLPLARQHFKEAEYKVGLFFLYGRGDLEQSNEKARKAFLLSANKGHREAEYYYGICCKNGIGGESSESEALIYLKKAHAKGSYEAGRAIEELRASNPELFT